ncbi:putative uridine-cytidine kinase-like protein [Polychytrium aggregatum]|uniref:putative uridine-cytidine kinase-like protein n=1 Tax=Polychytrium aggregatum TaxID=110093 RepID=UPI0022FE2872|nr:putative uridine-cytidine kinase-like protein [Polychytrium aggregatum]KAI9207226.1 putative uridine-cytidine kinase-like protein [Polychytrium aggregatum]
MSSYTNPNSLLRSVLTSMENVAESKPLTFPLPMTPDWKAAKTDDVTPFDLNSSPAPILIGVTGGSSAGKGEVCDQIKSILVSKGLSPESIVFIRQENFYKTLVGECLLSAQKGDYNFDHPDAFDWPLLESVIKDLHQGLPVKLPIYNFKTYERLPETTEISCPKVAIFTGIHMLYERHIREALALKIFVDVDSDLRLARQVIRDTEDRHSHKLETVLLHYVKFSKPAFEDFILPSKRYADMIIPRGKDNEVAIQLLAYHIVDTLQQRDREFKERQSEAVFGTTRDSSAHHSSHNLSPAKKRVSTSLRMASLGGSIEDSSFTALPK